MNEVDKFAAACEDLYRKAQWEEIGTQRSGHVMLIDLLRMLHESTEFCTRHDVSFSLNVVEDERVVVIYHAGLPTARWERDGDTLKLYAVDRDVPLEVTTTKDAYESTVYFILDLAKVIARYVVEPAIKNLPPPAAGEPPRFGFISPRG